MGVPTKETSSDVPVDSEEDQTDSEEGNVYIYLFLIKIG